MTTEPREYAALFPTPDRLTWYYVPVMLQAEAGTLRYNRSAYPIHGVPNNAIRAVWHGLLADGPDGMVLTDVGRRLLEEWKASDEGKVVWAARQRECECDDRDAPVESARPAPVEPVQLDIFGDLPKVSAHKHAGEHGPTVKVYGPSGEVL